MSGIPVLVAGGAGFVGSALCRDLLRHGARVSVFDSLLHGSQANLAGLDLEIVVGDACEAETLDRCLQRIRPQLVVNCMGDTFVTTAYDHTLRFLRNNVEATHNLLRCARRAGVKRILQLSSTEVYDARSGQALSERSALNPLNSYAVTKLAADRLCATMCMESGIPVLIARLFNCYGPRETHAYLIPEIIDQLHHGDQLTLGSLHAARDFTFVEDTVRALAALLVADAAPGSVVNVGSGVAHSVAEIAGAIGAIMRPEGFSLHSDPRRFRRREIERFQCDYRRLNQLTGWKPQISLSEGLERTIDWYRENGACWPWKHAASERPLAVIDKPALAPFPDQLVQTSWRPR
ncbi:MAG: NAD(P)-dependent oxidoreductase [Xanthomonadales bacterium]|nr:NAD(P)-dependent oxidoreductase [Xanthomonadales bacterium]